MLFNKLLLLLFSSFEVREMSSLHTIIEHEESGDSLHQQTREDLNLTLKRFQTPESPYDGHMAAHSSASKTITPSKQTFYSMLHSSNGVNKMKKKFEVYLIYSIIFLYYCIVLCDNFKPFQQSACQKTRTETFV